MFNIGIELLVNAWEIAISINLNLFLGTSESASLNDNRNIIALTNQYPLTKKYFLCSNYHFILNYTGMKNTLTKNNIQIVQFTGIFCKSMHE